MPAADVAYRARPTGTFGRLETLEQYALILSALCHDLEHPVRSMPLHYDATHCPGQRLVPTRCYGATNPVLMGCYAPTGREQPLPGLHQVRARYALQRPVRTCLLRHVP
eukprot:2855364-Rhodomonas_salina.2